MRSYTPLSIILFVVLIFLNNLEAFNYDGPIQVTVADFIVSDNGAIGRKCSPTIAVDGGGNFVIAWRDGRYNEYYDMYAQRFNSSGTPIGANFKVNDYAQYKYSEWNSIAIDDSGNFVISWVNNTDVFAQLYNSSGIASGKNIKVTDTTGQNYWARYTSTGFDQSGNFTILWWYWLSGYDSLNYEMQRYDNTGTPIGTNTTVITITPAFSYYTTVNPFTFDKDGNFIITWDSITSDPDTRSIYAQMFNNAGTQITNIFKVSDDNLGRIQGQPSAGYDNSGNVIITWVDEREINYAIYAQKYDSTGTAIGTNFRVTDDVGGLRKYLPKPAADKSDNFMIAWVDDRDGNELPRIYAQRYNNSGDTIGGNFKINNVDTMRIEWYDPYSMKLHDGKIYTTWQVHYGNQETDKIWANVLDWNNPIAILNEQNSQNSGVDRSRLFQNHPNPFKNLTHIRYSLTKNQKVSLMVYTISGQIVKKLINERKPAGRHTIAWDGRNEAGRAVPAGVYVYKILTDDFKQIKRMIVRK